MRLTIRDDTFFYKGARVRLRSLFKERSHTSVGYRAGGETKIFAWMLPFFRLHIERLSTEDGQAALKKYSVNEYYFLLLACVASVVGPLPFGAEEVRSAALMLQRLYPNRDLLQRVLDRPTSLSQDELALARQDGLFVTDDSWCWIDDQDTINPLYLVR